MSARSRFAKKSAQEIESTEAQSTEPAQIGSAEIESTETESTEPNQIEVAEVVTDQGDSNDQPEEPISESTDQAAEVSQAEVTDPVNDPANDPTPNEPDNGPLVADTAPMATSPVSQGTDAPTAPTSGGRDPRLPAVGSTITRKYKDRDLNVKVLDHGFEYEGAVYKSLSKLAGIISGQTCNGFAFFRLTGNAPGAAAPKAPRQATKPSGDKLGDKIAKIDAMILKLKAALDEGAQALAEAELKRAEMVGVAEQAQPAD